MARETYRTASALEVDTRPDAHSVQKWAVRISAASVGWKLSAGLLVPPPATPTPRPRPRPRPLPLLPWLASEMDAVKDAATAGCDDHVGHAAVDTDPGAGGICMVCGSGRAAAAGVEASGADAPPPCSWACCWAATTLKGELGEGWRRLMVAMDRVGPGLGAPCRQEVPSRWQREHCHIWGMGMWGVCDKVSDTGVPIRAKRHVKGNPMSYRREQAVAAHLCPVEFDEKVIVRRERDFVRAQFWTATRDSPSPSSQFKTSQIKPNKSMRQSCL